jgi:hypothetical protein
MCSPLHGSGYCLYDLTPHRGRSRNKFLRMCVQWPHPLSLSQAHNYLSVTAGTGRHWAHQLWNSLASCITIMQKEGLEALCTIFWHCNNRSHHMVLILRATSTTELEIAGPSNSQSHEVSPSSRVCWKLLRDCNLIGPARTAAVPGNCAESLQTLSSCWGDAILGWLARLLWAATQLQAGQADSRTHWIHIQSTEHWNLWIMDTQFFSINNF